MGDENVLELDRKYWLHIVNVLNATELLILKWLIVCSMNFISIKKKIGSPNVMWYSGLDSGTEKNVSGKTGEIQ